MTKDNFSVQSKAYAQFRPKFPTELYDFIYAHTNNFQLAWDVGTGNGQTATELSNRFQHVVATDISENQLKQAPPLANVEYRAETAEESSLENHSVDLITIAQALHWFDFDRFYEEARSVARHGATVAAFCYSMLQMEEDKLNEVLQAFYQSSAPYWDAERKYIDEQYQTIPFPFTEIPTPSFNISYEWTIDQLIGYIETWSANQHYIRQHGKSMVSPEFMAVLKADWPLKGSAAIAFPVHLRIGHI